MLQLGSFPILSTSEKVRFFPTFFCCFPFWTHQEPLHWDVPGPHMVPGVKPQRLAPVRPRKGADRRISEVPHVITVIASWIANHRFWETPHLNDFAHIPPGKMGPQTSPFTPTIRKKLLHKLLVKHPGAHLPVVCGWDLGTIATPKTIGEDDPNVQRPSSTWGFGGSKFF